LGCDAVGYGAVGWGAVVVNTGTGTGRARDFVCLPDPSSSVCLSLSVGWVGEFERGVGG
jgi:hypothetical protein